jgi:TRAP-type C4-dicarboxylate transport system permease small subunit
MKVFDYIFNVVKVALVICFICLACLVFAQVFVRYVTNASLVWSEELARFLMIWTVYLGCAVTYRERRHMAVDNLINALGPLPKKVVEAISMALQITFLLVMTVGAYRILPVVALQRSATNQINMSYVYSILFISGSLMLLSLVERFLIRFLPAGKSEGGGS